MHCLLLLIVVDTFLQEIEVLLNVLVVRTASVEIGSVVDSVAQLMLYVGGVVGVVGAIRIYIKWNNGDQDVTKAIVGWGGACLFLVLSGGVIKLVFGITGAGA